MTTTTSNTIRIGTRGSCLALWQTHHVADLLQAAGFETEVVVISTKGDQILDRSLDKIGAKGVFTEELEESLRNGD
ncbi:MAG: hydroxymethylbilane synthase, partial [Hymenobacteraceae bacterium]|nr:hydroxymethylbilane synthase [Hymenobacteraceae bacterium]MDX5398061.1 hydroxymethylbilane synthase [Hymenobacteraceae bacterium]MDX5514132.1 hydroxymethylbilane synthase [Hymenobacteraceae bacterium]